MAEAVLKRPGAQVAGAASARGPCLPGDPRSAFSGARTAGELPSDALPHWPACSRPRQRGRELALCEGLPSDAASFGEETAAKYPIKVQLRQAFGGKTCTAVSICSHVAQLHVFFDKRRGLA